MIPAAFDYVRAEFGRRGHRPHRPSTATRPSSSPAGTRLLPLMKLRLAQPTVLIDIGRLQRPVVHPRRRRPHRHRRPHPPPRRRDAPTLLAAARAAAGARGRATSATRRCATAARSAARSPTPTRRRTCPATVARPRRARSWPRARTASGRSPPSDFFTGFLESALAPDELLTEIRVPKMPGAGWCFQKFNRRAQDWAIVGVAAGGATATPGVALVNMGSTPILAQAVRRRPGRRARRPPTPPSRPPPRPSRRPTSTPSVEYRTHLAKVLVRRALEEAGA